MIALSDPVEPRRNLVARARQTSVLMMNRGIRTSIVGVGAWGKNVARELSAVSDLAGYVSARPDRLGWLPRLSIDEILSDPTIKAVAVVTPIALLSQFARLALNAEKHVFVEKPLARTAAEAQVLAEAAQMRHLILATGYQFVYHPVYTELKRRLDRESVRRVTLEWRKFGTFVDTIEHVLLTHHLAIALDLLGEPLSGTIRRNAAIKTACDKVETTLLYRNCEVRSLIDRHANERSHIIQVELLNGSSFIWDGNHLLLRRATGGVVETLYEAQGTSLAVELSSFIGAISGNRMLLSTAGNFGARVLSIYEMLAAIK